MASQRAQNRVAAAQIRERLAQRRQLEEDVLTRAGAAMIAAEERHAQAVAADAERDRLLAVAGWVLRPEDAAAVLGVSVQRLRAARRNFRSERDAIAAVVRAGHGGHDAATDGLTDGAPIGGRSVSVMGASR
ncbi:MAG: hypothetical protein ACR2LE_00105 [Nocardioidaceae bacterium]